MTTALPHTTSDPFSIELWGSLECSVVRVGQEYYDQLACSGHDRRETDLDLFAGHGLKTLRYPLSWERVAPRGTRSADWSLPDRRLERLRELGVEPVVSLMCHGGGPLDTSLVDPSFPTRLTTYARAVSERYPWVEAYTPIEEPLATARQSGLLGHWYPHGRDERTFVRALVTQCRATARVMRVVRLTNPAARLVQTESLGRVRSTPGLAYQADFENERRWLTFDLLAGRVVPGHPLYGYLVRAGISPAELDHFADKPCPPDLFGINYRVANERFLDERLALYPPELHVANSRQRYADVEAVRACAAGLFGPAHLLGEVFHRYHKPIAITETHLGCTPDERLRWLVHVWREARFARAKGADVRAVTAGALLGSYDWAALVRGDVSHYEPGAFCLVKGEPRPSLVAEALRWLSQGREFEHRALGQPGWWQRPERLRYAAFEPAVNVPEVGARHSQAAE